MPEETGPQDHLVKEGHFPNTGTALLELYRLLAIFLASKSFASLRTHYPGEGNDPIYKLQEVEDDEITRILLYLAIVARVIDDREQRIFELLGSTCGNVRTGGSDSEAKPLELRDACNKIIHAKRIRIDVERDGVQPYFNPFIYLHGETPDRRPWNVTLDVVAFAKEYATLVANF